MKTNSILLTVICLSFASCTTTMYVSNTVNVPLMKEKGEVKINADQNDLQLAVAVSDHVGIMVNGFYKSYKGDKEYLHKGQMGEIGIGYFKAFKNNIVVETYTGFGIGTVYKQQTFSENGTEHSASFNAQAGRAFIQSGIGYCTRYFDVALTPRFSFVKYTHFASSNYTTNQLEADYLNNDRLTNEMFIFAEPTLTVRGGYKFIKLQAQYGLTINTGNQKIKYSPDFATLGLVIDIAKWYNQ